ncbi:MAG: hypothetical protein NTW87_25115 [Planctomycetota bacterium]|nr:hypothetical protein [Planctomycetota bacterium]
MKISVIVAVVVVVFALAVALCLRRSKAPSPAIRQLRLTLVAGWYEEPGKSPRTFRRRADGSGVLQISLQPPLKRKVTTGEEAENELARLLDSLGMDLGERQLMAHDKCSSGILATAIYKSQKQGLLQFWLIPREVTVFASYTMGSLETVRQEVAEANEMVKTATLE